MDDRWGVHRPKSMQVRSAQIAGMAAAVCLALSACALVRPGGAATEPASPAPSATGTTPETTSSGRPQAWPDETNTGVPEGTQLTDYTGECRITEPNTVIDAKTVNCDLNIRAAGVTITRSVINGTVTLRKPEEGYSVTISDSEIRAGERLVTALGNGNYTAQRVEITGGGRSVYCQTDCTIENSFVHGQTGDPSGEAHLSGVRMGQNSTIRFNTIICEGTRTPPASGCSAALTGYGDFAPIQNNLIEGNQFIGVNASFCAFGGSSRAKPFSDQARDIRFINNVFVRGETGKCGNLAPIEAFDSDAPGNVWEGNTWDDGEPLPPRN